jgi:hypothetical protein
MIYMLFLNEWLGHGTTITNLAQLAERPSDDEFGKYADCLKEAQLPAVSAALQSIDLRDSILKSRRDIRLVDAHRWHPDDPGTAMASGATVGQAVTQGFAGGLLTLSTIAFDENHSSAIFTHFFVCGRLCGSGGTAIFQKTQGVWKQIRHQCGGWIS